MQARHRIPSVFSLSMVDVLCCALGCVILLWLLNLRDARERADEAGATHTDLVKVEEQLQTTRRDRDDLEARLRAARTEADRRIDDLTRQLQTMTAERQSAADLLRKKREENETMDRQFTAATQLLDTLSGLVRDQEDQINRMARDRDVAAKQLADADGRIRRLQAQVDTLPAMQKSTDTARSALEKAEATVLVQAKDLERLRKEMDALQAMRQQLARDLESRNKALGEANRGLLSLEEDKRKLTQEVGRVRSSLDSRFAGISLTGRQVVFLIDLSRSMELLNAKTEDAKKWPEVCDTVGRVMRSMPQLERFQVITFSKEVAFPLGTEGRWLPYDGEATAEEVARKLKQLKPDGGTDMYAAMERAFRYRELGMDTIYLLSDGLPNMGEGSPANASQLSEVQLGEMLGRHIRQTLRTLWNRPIADRPKVHINAIGFFYESPDVGAFLWALARENEGNFVGMSKP